MDRKSVPVRFAMKTALALTALALAVASLSSCRSVRREPVSAAPPALSRPAEPVAGAPSAEAWTPNAPGSTSVERFGESPVEVEPIPVEEPAESSLEELADAIDTPPEYDLPMVVNDQVMFWVDHYAVRHRATFLPGLVRSGRYIDMFRRIFEEEGLPADLAYMAHVESAYKVNAYSRARAKGVFQFISATGKRYGLRIDDWVDERSDPEKSARAAAAFLTDLHDQFGDWYLALAAYNAGEGKIRRALAKSGKNDFWGVARTQYIRRETRNYVPAILAATIISKDPGAYGFVFEADAPLVYDTIRVEGAADLRVLATCAGVDLQTLEDLNRSLRHKQTPPGAKTDVRLPVGRGERTLAALGAIPRGERVLYARHPVRSGDTLSDLSRQYGVSVRRIQQANDMGRRTLIRAGRVVLIPTAATADYAPAPSGDLPRGEVASYRVRRGDTLYGIARRYETTATSIAAASQIDVNQVLRIGQPLRVVSGVRSPADARKIAAGGSAIASARSGANVTHTVRRGDSLWKIANSYGTTVGAICELNGISSRSVLRPGKQLTVR